MAHARNRRKHIRLPGNRALVRAAWLDVNGVLKMGHARLIDISEGGLALELPEAPQNNSRLRFQCDTLRLYGTGTVRYGSASHGRCIIGVQFSSDTRWKPKGDLKEDSPLPPRIVFQAPVELHWDWNSAP